VLKAERRSTEIFVGSAFDLRDGVAQEKFRRVLSERSGAKRVYCVIAPHMNAEAVNRHLDQIIGPGEEGEEVDAAWGSWTHFEANK
jgi:hypothetical protein